MMSALAQHKTETTVGISSLRSDLNQNAAETRQRMAEQDARHQQQLNRLTVTLLAGMSLISAVTGVLVAVFG